MPKHAHQSSGKKRGRYHPWLSLPSILKEPPPGFLSITVQCSPKWGYGKPNGTPFSLYVYLPAQSIYWQIDKHSSQKVERILLGTMGEPHVNEMYWNAVQKDHPIPRIIVRPTAEEGKDYFYLNQKGRESFLFHLSGSGNITRITKRPISIFVLMALVENFADKFAKDFEGLYWASGPNNLRAAADVSYR